MCQRLQHRVGATHLLASRPSSQFDTISWQVVELEALSLRLEMPTGRVATHDELLRANNTIIAEMESSVILAIKAFEVATPAQVCLNSSTYGGEEVGLLARQTDLEDLRNNVVAACRQLEPPTTKPHLPTASKIFAVEQVFEELLRDVRAAASKGAKTSVIANDAAVAQATVNVLAGLPGLQTTTTPVDAVTRPVKRSKVDRQAVSPCRVLQLATDITLGDCLARSTFWGTLAGSGPKVIREALDWAQGESQRPGTDDLEELAQRYGGMVDVWPVSAFHPDILFVRTARFVADIADLVSPDLLIVHSAKSYLLLKDGAFSHGKSAFRDRFSGPNVSPTSDQVWKSLPDKRFVLRAGELSLVNVGNQVSIPAMATPDFGVVKYDPAFRVGFLRLAHFLALKQMLLRAAVQDSKAKVSLAVLTDEGRN